MSLARSLGQMRQVLSPLYGFLIACISPSTQTLNTQPRSPVHDLDKRRSSPAKIDFVDGGAGSDNSCTDPLPEAGTDGSSAVGTHLRMVNIRINREPRNMRASHASGRFLGICLAALVTAF